MKNSALFKSLESNPINVLVFTFVLSLLVKLFLCLPFNGPILFFDEFYYKENALSLLDLKYYTNHYPPLYSIFLMLGFQFENYYLGFKIVNVIISSLIIVPTWLLSSHLTTKKKAVFISVLSLMLPYHFVYNKMVMSENLFYTLLMFFVYALYMQMITKQMKWIILSGLSIALCILTRYFAVVLVPVYIVSVITDYLIRNKWSFDEIKPLLTRLGIALAIFVSVFGLFLLFSYEDFMNTVSQYLNKTNKGEYRIFSWILIYFAYFITLIAPFVYFISQNFKDLTKKNSQTLSLVVISIALTVMFVVLAAHHSTGGHLEKKYMNGRYILYLAMPWITLGVLSINVKKSMLMRIIAGAVSLIIVFFSYKIINGDVINTADWLLIPHMSPYGIIFKNYYLFFIITTLLAIVIANIEKVKNYVYYLFIIIFVFSIKFSLNILDDPIGTHGNAILNYVTDSKQKTIYNGTPCFDYQYYHFLNFWGKYGVSVKSVPKSLKECGNGYAVLTQKVRKNEPLSVYSHRGKKYYIYETPLNFSDNAVNLILDTTATIKFMNPKERNDNPFKSSIAFVKNRSQIFCLENSSIAINKMLNPDNNYSAYFQFGFYPDAKNWGVSDGMMFTVEYKDSLQNKKLFEQYVMPKDDDYEIQVDLPKDRSGDFQLLLSTHNSGKDNRGDWGCWKLIEVEKK